MELPARLKMPGRHMKRDVYALYLAARDPATPWYVKAVLLAAVVYLVSPIDLMPDLTPVLGYVDDLAVVPMLLALAMSLVPAPVKERCRARADRASRTGTRAARLGGAFAALALLAVAAAVLAVLLRAALA
jgi:uncharacterized membrane protein YkvA (DUF1232 family)